VRLINVFFRKHMVSLRGSKYGSRVAMLCTNHNANTRPGPPAGLSNPGRYTASSYINNTANNRNGQNGYRG
jgi:hypothetical protein